MVSRPRLESYRVAEERREAGKTDDAASPSSEREGCCCAGPSFLARPATGARPDGVPSPLPVWIAIGGGPPRAGGGDASVDDDDDDDDDVPLGLTNCGLPRGRAGAEFDGVSGWRPRLPPPWGGDEYCCCCCCCCCWRP